jgi:hypothetical protein
VSDESPIVGAQIVATLRDEIEGIVGITNVEGEAAFVGEFVKFRPIDDKTCRAPGDGVTGSQLALEIRLPDDVATVGSIDLTLENAKVIGEFIVEVVAISAPYLLDM